MLAAALAVGSSSLFGVADQAAGSVHLRHPTGSSSRGHRDGGGDGHRYETLASEATASRSCSRAGGRGRHRERWRPADLGPPDCMAEFARRPCCSLAAYLGEEQATRCIRAFLAAHHGGRVGAVIVQPDLGSLGAGAWRWGAAGRRSQAETSPDHASSVATVIATMSGHRQPVPVATHRGVLQPGFHRPSAARLHLPTSQRHPPRVASPARDGCKAP
jgi:hypothetical protein